MNHRNVQVRLATASDAPRIATVLHDSFVEFRTLYTDGGFAATTPPAKMVRARLAEGPTWVALYDAAIVGTVAAVAQGIRLYIRSMAVLPSARGHGIGKALLEQIEKFASEQGFRRLYLSTTPFLLSAIRLYELFGFERTSEGPHELFGTPLFTMEKKIAAAPG
jgi:ribosomal protein S18 acetylase RimI-like enzyme